ncbi:DUF342 domain-containing protein [Piscibacillus halophilus]|uniref:Flagellar Assembly Protein A N-terminal region domain-containing protein n=1 Tax=Piscibacillus halophilus TaxID=571933 RepID=A0A1H8Z0G4_9BACI|nr:FapA family protein [Piscibacillus halophilus]SEP57836.1 hypothetical protein SAMN05216362_101159 [Piscibacillus halophilus]
MDLKKIFNITTSDQYLYAYLHLVNRSEWESSHEPSDVLINELIKFLHHHKIQYGIKQDVLHSIIKNIDEVQFPVLIAEGMPPVNGVDGSVEFKVDHSVRMELNKREQIDFKNVMKIPTVEPGEIIAVIHDPTIGQAGKNVYGEVLKPKEGVSISLAAGENTTYVEEEQAIYASNFGQVSLINQEIKVLPLYEVSSTLDLKTGSIDFNGSVLIKGDVPEGFKVDAKGDITIEGLVEGANITAGGSIYIREGITAIGKGAIKAGVDLTTNHINQGYVYAGRHIRVEQSIIHSNVSAGASISCQKGHVIGGTVSAGNSISCQDIGNRMHTPTQVFLGESKTSREHRVNTDIEYEKLKSEVSKLTQLGQLLKRKQQQEGLSNKEKLTLEKQTQLLVEKQLKLQELSKEYEAFDQYYDLSEFMKLTIHGTLYPNTEMFSGKYSKKFNRIQQKVVVLFKENDFYTEPID